MDIWEWLVVGLGVVAVLYILGTVVWAIFDVLKQDHLQSSDKVLWVAIVAFVPLFGAVIWMWVKPRALRATPKLPKA